METTISNTMQGDAERVEAWRLSELPRAGYPIRIAELVATSEADLHLACDLVAQGCEPELAAEILT